MNKLLLRQIRKVFGDISSVPDKIEEFVKIVNDAYNGFDADRALMDRSLEISSKEMKETFELLKEENAQRKKAEEFALNALHDPLTQLPNRKLFLQYLKETMARSKRNKDYIFAVFFFDVDKFKEVNDTLGHLIGDRFLVEVASRLKICLRENDILARLGGDEFTIIVDDLNSIDSVMFIADRILNAFDDPILIEQNEIFTSGSIGILLNNNHLHASAEDILRDADTAMYHAKASGRNRYKIFHEQMHEKIVAKVNLQNELRKAIQNKEFEMYFQPIYSVFDQNKILGLESLIRWNHPQRGLVMPGEFIQLSEDTGLIVPLTEWILDDVMSRCRVWQDQGVDIRVAVNISMSMFNKYDLVTFMKDKLTKFGLRASFIELEITEDVAMKNREFTLKTIRELHDLGHNISIDDFGTGYTSFNYLKQFPVTSIKIDRNFIKDVVTDASISSIVKAMMAMAKQLKIKIIAEGVETQAQHNFLIEHQCEEMQGFLFKRPIPFAEVSSLLQPVQASPCEKIDSI